MTGTLFIIAAPSGGGKTSLVHALIESIPDLKVSISHTTRTSRPGEVNGSHYWFVSEAEFQAMVQARAFLEHAKVFGHYYGTSRDWVLKQLQANIDIILEIDWQGARQAREQFPEAVSIFILPPSRAVLEQRLSARKQDNQEVIARRMAAANLEISHYHEFDYLVINDIFSQALADLQAIITAQRLRRDKQQIKQAQLLAELLETQ